MTASIATILFTDVVDSAALMQRLGDERTGGRLEDWGASCHENQFSSPCVSWLTIRRYGARPSVVGRLGSRSRPVESDARNVNQRSLPGVDGVSP
jgi:hypothetical protein